MMNSTTKPGQEGPLWESRRRWSLWDMLKIYADNYLRLGQGMQALRATLVFADKPEDKDEEYLRKVGKRLGAILGLCRELDLPISLAVFEKFQTDFPGTVEELDVALVALFAELKNKAFLFVPPDRAVWYEVILPTVMTNPFPSATQEIVQAGNAYAVGLPTASVFHCMRAVEVGVRALATELNVTFSYPLELAEWGTIVSEIEPKIEAIKQKPRSAQRDADLKFYSEAASQFRHFNNGWRIRVAHARESYNEAQAKIVLEHTVSFFETLATRLKE